MYGHSEKFSRSFKSELFCSFFFFKVLSRKYGQKYVFFYVAVAFARLLFPAEAKVAMDNAEAESTLLYGSYLANLREVDLNETPSVRTRKLQLRLHALQKTGMLERMFQVSSFY